MRERQPCDLLRAEWQFCPLPTRPLSLLDELEILAVRWRDAFFEHEVAPGEASRADYIVTTVGIHAGTDELFVHLAAEQLPDGDGWRAVTHIPVDLVVSQVRLRPAPTDAVEIRLAPGA